MLRLLRSLWCVKVLARSLPDESCNEVLVSVGQEAMLMFVGFDDPELNTYEPAEG